MTRILAIAQIAWLVAGALLLWANTFCSGDSCSEGQWFGTILGLIAWSLVEVPLALALVAAVTHSLIVRLAGER